jgi:arginine deiminase
MEFKQLHENEPADIVIIHEPSYEIFMSMLHPAASLYSDVTNEKEVHSEFNELREILKHESIKLMTVRDCLKLNRTDLIGLAQTSLTYECTNKHEGDDNKEFKYYLSDEYKVSVLNKLTNDQLVDVVLTRPTYTMKYVSVNTYVEPVNISFRPLGNLLFVRDQQITTQKGVVLGRTMTWAREKEKDIMLQVFKNLKVKIIGEIPEGSYLEGGDFFILKENLAILGIGMRTTMEAAKFLMVNDLLGTERFALVFDENDFTQQRMHLDTFFNIINEHSVLLLDFEQLSKTSGRTISRSVKIYSKVHLEGNTNPSIGEYKLVKEYEDFQTFLNDEGFKIVKSTHEQQTDFLINFLNIGNNKIIAVNHELKAKLEKENIDVEVLDVNFKSIVKMYGAVHCATQVARKASFFQNDEKLNI